MKNAKSKGREAKKLSDLGGGGGVPHPFKFL